LDGSNTIGCHGWRSVRRKQSKLKIELELRLLFYRSSIIIISNTKIPIDKHYETKKNLATLNPTNICRRFISRIRRKYREDGRLYRNLP